VFGGDVALQYISHSTPRRPGATEAWWTSDFRTELIRSMREAGTRVYPNVPAQMLKTLRLGSEGLQPLSPAVSDAVAVLCDELGIPATYPPTGYGFNNPAGVWTADSVELAIVGDSYTQGVCVPPGQSFADRMRATWPGLLNVGVAGAGPLSELGILKEYVAAKRPRTVLWVYYEGNDLQDLQLEESDDLLGRYLQPGFSQGLTSRQASIDSLLARYVDSLMVSRGAADVGMLAPLAVPRHSEILRGGLRVSALRRVAGVGALVPRRGSSIGSLPQVLEEAKRTAESWGGELVLVYLPGYQRFYSWLGDPFRGRNEVLATAESLGIEMIDLVPAFQKTGDPRGLWAHPRGHLSAEGYSYVADVITKGLATLSR